MQELKPVDAFEQKETNEPKKVESVVSNPVKTKKRTFWNKIADEFVSEDGKGIMDYIIIDVIVPAIKKTISDVVTNGIDMLLYGTSKHNSNSSNIPAYRVSYRSYYDQRNSDYTRPRVNSQGYDYNDILFQTRGDADAVLNGLRDIITQYGLAKVADYYDLAGANCSYTDNNYGWTDLRYAQVIRVNSGYSLRMPKPMPID